MVTTTQVIGGIGALIVIVGAFLPWATWGLFSVAGIEGDGVTTLILGLIAGVAVNKKKVVEIFEPTFTSLTSTPRNSKEGGEA